MLPLGEHLVDALVLDDADVLDPRGRHDRVGRPADPAQAVDRDGVAEVPVRRPVVVVAGVPEVVDPVLEQDPAALADLPVPAPFEAGPPEDGVGRDRGPGDQVPGEVVGGRRAGEAEARARRRGSRFGVAWMPRGGQGLGRSSPGRQVRPRAAAGQGAAGAGRRRCRYCADVEHVGEWGRSGDHPDARPARRRPPARPPAPGTPRRGIHP